MILAFKQRNKTYFDSVEILRGGQGVDVILQLDHLLHHSHDAGVNMIP